MAQIRVVEKRGGLAWLWSVLALIIAAVLVWYFMGHRITASTGETAPAAAPAQTRKDTVVLRYHPSASPEVLPRLVFGDAHHSSTPSPTA